MEHQNITTAGGTAWKKLHKTICYKLDRIDRCQKVSSEIPGRSLAMLYPSAGVFVAAIRLYPTLFSQFNTTETNIVMCASPTSEAGSEMTRTSPTTQAGPLVVNE